MDAAILMRDLRMRMREMRAEGGVMARLLSVAAFLWLVLCGTEAFEQESGDVAAGHRLGQQWCSECHEIDAKRPVNSEAGAPSFVEVANEASTTPLSLRVFFRSNHEKMPDLHISPAQADDLIAYILSLKKK
jgi:cytochrome c